MPVVLVGARIKEKENFMAVGWCSRANANPPMILCGIGNHHFTPEGIHETKSFSVNLPSSDLLERVDYCGLVSGKNTDKSRVFTTFYGALKTAPMIQECPIAMECQLVQEVKLPTNTVFIGEITGVYADKEIIKDGKPDFGTLDPLLLTMPDNHYWTLGEQVGNAWSAGSGLKKAAR